MPFEGAFLAAVILALPTRIEFEREAETGGSSRAESEELLTDWAKSVLDNLGNLSEKKKS
jgi:hypothetical protein